MVEDEPSAAQRSVLELIYRTFRHHGGWPRYRYLNAVAFKELGLDLDDLYPNFPHGLVQPEGPIPSPAQTVALTAHGLAYCRDSEKDVELFLALVRLVGERARAYEPPPDADADLTVTSAEAAAVLGVEEGSQELRLAHALMLSSAWRLWAGSSGPDEVGCWALTITPEEARRYADINSAAELAARHPLPQHGEAVHPRLWRPSRLLTWWYRLSPVLKSISALVAFLAALAGIATFILVYVVDGGGPATDNAEKLSRTAPGDGGERQPFGPGPVPRIVSGGEIVTVRSGPGTDYPSVGTLRDGTAVTIICTLRGEEVTPYLGRTNLWDKVRAIGLKRPGFVSDGLVYTRTTQATKPSCR